MWYVIHDSNSALSFCRKLSLTCSFVAFLHWFSHIHIGLVDADEVLHCPVEQEDAGGRQQLQIQILQDDARGRQQLQIWQSATTNTIISNYKYYNHEQDDAGGRQQLQILQWGQWIVRILFQPDGSCSSDSWKAGVTCKIPTSKGRNSYYNNIPVFLL